MSLSTVTYNTTRVRKKFETNSSSSHTFTIDSGKDVYPEFILSEFRDTHIVLYGQEFMNRIDVLDTFKDKLNYALQYFEDNGIPNYLRGLIKQELNSTLEFVHTENQYINNDNGTNEWVYNLRNFIFNPRSYVLLVTE